MKHLLFGIVVGLFATAAFAQTCDITQSMTMVRGEARDIEAVVNYKGLTAAEHADITKRSLAVLDTASRGQDKGGPYTFLFKWATSCGSPTPDVEVRGVSAKDAARVWRAATKASDETIRKGELRANKGSKKIIGKE